MGVVIVFGCSAWRPFWEGERLNPSKEENRYEMDEMDEMRGSIWDHFVFRQHSLMMRQVSFASGHHPLNLINNFRKNTPNSGS